VPTPASGGETDCLWCGCLAFMPSAYLFVRTSPRLLATSAFAKSWKISAVQLVTPYRSLWLLKGRCRAETAEMKISINGTSQVAFSSDTIRAAISRSPMIT
jgi:hypothetical protein